MLRSIILITKAIIREQRLRRSIMFWVMMVAMLMLFFGSWLLSDRWGRDHPFLFMGYWVLCAWLTLIGMLLALLEILVLRATQRAARRMLEKQILDDAREKKKDAE